MYGTLIAHLWNALPNATFPEATFRAHASLRSSGSCFRIRVFTSVMIFTNRCSIASGEILSSFTRRSTLLMKRTGYTRSFNAWRITVSV